MIFLGKNDKRHGDLAPPKIKHLTFADNIVLISDNVDDMATRLKLKRKNQRCQNKINDKFNAIMEFYANIVKEKVAHRMGNLGKLKNMFISDIPHSPKKK